jgi:phospholipase C
MEIMNPIMSQINNIVFLMLENRSLDDLLGWLYSGSKPQHFYPESNTAPYDGLAAGRYFNPAHSLGSVKKYPVVPIPDEYKTYRVPAYDPYEAMREGSGGEWNGVMNQLFGNQDIINSMPKDGVPPEMLGFLQDYYSDYMVSWQGLDILWTYTPQQLGVINGLAHQFAVSDRWFCSIPTQTNPNRAYSLCGTSLGREANSNLQAVEQFNIPTVINSLASAGKSWGLYYQDIWQNKQCFTQYTFPRISSAQNGEIGTLQQFLARAKSGTLPAFTYLEPKWGYGKGAIYVQGNDYHPPTYVQPGEQFLGQVYLALRQSPQWRNTLFVVTFDEHGGTYDHVAPPWGATNPDGINGTKWGFDFHLFGSRVPTLLVSPYVHPGTVFREPTGSTFPYDHTSFIATFLRWAGIDPARAGLHNRVAVAPTFEGVLSNTPVNPSPELLPSVPFNAGKEMELKIPLKSPVEAKPSNGLFEGMPFAIVKAIINRSKDMEEVGHSVTGFKQDPEKFEASLIDQHVK